MAEIVWSMTATAILIDMLAYGTSTVRHLSTYFENMPVVDTFHEETTGSALLAIEEIKQDVLAYSSRTATFTAPAARQIEFLVEVLRFSF